MSVALLAPPDLDDGGSSVDLTLVPSDRVTAVRGEELDVVVSARRPVAADVVLLGLSRPDGSALPPWEPGAHIDLAVGSEPVRAFSLCGRPADRTRWSIAVGRRTSSVGVWWAGEERLPVGHPARVSLPRNCFPLVDGPCFLFVAQGTGIAPLHPMITTVAARRTNWRLLYLGESRSRMPFADELAQAHPDRVVVHAADELGAPDLASVLDGTADDGLVYCCGSAALVSSMAELCRDRPVGTFHVDRATGASTVADSRQMC